MKTYRRRIITWAGVLVALLAVTRWTQVWPAAAAQRGENRPAEQAGAARQTGFFGLAPGPAGPATELLKLMGVNQTDFGIKITRTFDASGKPAYETKGGDLLFFTNASVSYNSTADKPMIVVVNARTRKIIALADINIPSTPHGITLSPDARYIYLPSGFSIGEGRRRVGAAPTAVIDAKTLKLAALINTGGETHHTQVVADKYVMFDSFSGPLPIFLLDP